MHLLLLVVRQSCDFFFANRSPSFCVLVGDDWSSNYSYLHENASLVFCSEMVAWERTITAVRGSHVCRGTSVQGTNWLLRLYEPLWAGRMQDLSISGFTLACSVARNAAKSANIAFFACVSRAVFTAGYLYKIDIEYLR